MRTPDVTGASRARRVQRAPSESSRDEEAGTLAGTTAASSVGNAAITSRGWPGQAAPTMIGQYLKHLMVRSPLEQVAFGLKRALEWPERRRNPDLADIHAEPLLVETAIRRLLGRGSRCIDVGAHLGSQLSLFLRLAPQGPHLAFEPVPRKA